MKRWNTVKSHLLRNSESGKYYAVARVGGKLVWKSLKTTVRSVADLRLAAALSNIRAGERNENSVNITLGECAVLYLQRKEERGYRRRNRQGIEQSKSKPLKERSMQYRRETVEALRKLWTGFEEQMACLVTESMCHAVADKARKQYGPTRFNGIIQSLRGILDIAVENGALAANPSLGVSFAEVKPSDKPIPSREQMTEVLRLLDARPERKFARLSVRAMAFTGLRPNEARHLTKADVDLAAGTLTSRETKNGKPRTIQLISQATDLFKEEGVEKVLEALRKNPRKSLMTIGAKIGINLTPYTMRHLHMTALLESGVDLQTIALISGHQDRGVTLLRHYLHARPEHVRKQISKVVI